MEPGMDCAVTLHDRTTIEVHAVVIHIPDCVVTVRLTFSETTCSCLNIYCRRIKLLHQCAVIKYFATTMQVFIDIHQQKPVTCNYLT